jgi:hypothetical protein
MNKIIIPFVAAVFFSSSVFAENIQEEAIDSLSTASTFVKKGNYNKAIEEINYALSKINELTASGLLKFIPKPPQGFTLDNKQSQGTGAAASIAGNAGATASYSNPAGSVLNLNIAIGGMSGKMASLAAFGQMFAGLAQNAGGPQSKQIRVNGYTGTQIFNSQEMSGTLTFQVGQKTSVTIEGNNIQSPETLKALAKNIDFQGLEDNF